jgi:hypothetical protein
MLSPEYVAGLFDGGSGLFDELKEQRQNVS